MFAQGFAIKKELINGKPVMEQGIMGKVNNQGARIIEVSDGRAKYTELSRGDIEKLISVRSSPSDLMERLIPLLKRKKHLHHTRRHHRRHHRRHGVARGHTKRHKKRKTHKRKHRRKHRRKHKRTKRRKRK
jgi:hypothetical protein